MHSWLETKDNKENGIEEIGTMYMARELGVRELAVETREPWYINRSRNTSVQKEDRDKQRGS